MFHDVQVFLGRAWRYATRAVSRAWVSAFAKKGEYAMTRYGSKYGGWFIPDDMPEGSLCYCVGVGRDASYDFALVEKGAEVHSFDPTPMSVEYMAKNEDKGVNFHPWGLWNEDTTMKFFVPGGENHSSHFVHDLHNTGKFHEVPCHRLTTMMDKLGHKDIYLLKMDIEGAWYESLMDFIPKGVTPKFLGIEFDSPAPPWRVAPVVKLLEKHGYSLVVQEKDNVTFARIAA